MMLIEREADLASILGILDAGGLAVIEGPAGIGKSSLLAAVADETRREGAALAVARGAALESTYPYGVTRQLFDPLISAGDRDALFAGTASAAALALDSDERRDDGEAIEFAVLRGLVALAANVAERSRLVLVVDDAQWADEPSLHFLAFLSRRLGAGDIAVAVGIRSGERFSNELLLDELKELGRETVRPHPLSSVAVAQLVRARAPDASDQQCAECHRASAGNPLLVVEMARAISDGEDPMEAASTGLGARVRRRMANAHPHGPVVAAAAAVLGEGATFARVSALADTSLEAAANAVAALRCAGILETTDTLGFVHPLVHAAVLESLDDAERIALHTAAADALAAESAPVEQVAAHHLAVPGSGSPRTLARLRAAAGSALGRGAAQPAVALLRRALAEPPAASERCTVLRELAAAERLAGDESAVTHLQVALALAPAPDERARTARELALAQYYLSRYADAAATLTAALRGAPEDLDPLVRDSLRVDLLTVALQVSSVDADGLQVDLARGPPPSDSAVELTYRIASVGMALTGGPVHERAPELERLLRSAPPRPDQLDFHTPLWFGLILCERFEAVRELIDGAEADGASWARRQFAINLARARLLHRRGELAGALATHETNLESAVDDWTGTLFTRAGLAAVCVDRGEVTRALSLIRAEDIPPSPDEAHLCFMHWSLGKARMAAGDDEGAVKAFDAGRAIQRTFPGDRAVIWEEGASDRITCYLRLGRQKEARAAAAEILAVARRTGLVGLGAIGLRSLGLIEDDTSALARSVELLDGGPLRLELARSLVELGAARRREGRRVDARGPLRRSLNIAHACGATLIADRAREELVMAGGRPRRDAGSGRDALTPAEWRVARRAAAGATNREIARELFVTVKTIEGHLAHAYRKLDIHRRRELGAALEKDSA